MSSHTATAVRSAYADVDETQSCPTCKAPPKVWCINPITGETRHIPCIHRPRRAVPAPTGCSPLTVPEESDQLDFTEPRHPAQRTER